MSRLHVLSEGSADTPVICEILTRRFGLVQGTEFLTNPYRGKGRLPQVLDAPPNPTDRTLLGLLPATLRAFGGESPAPKVLVLLDSDREICTDVKQELVTMYQALSVKPPHVLFRIAVEEVESWFLADPPAVRKAYPPSRGAVFPGPPHAQVIGAWEVLAGLIGFQPGNCSGRDKFDWGREIAPYLELDAPPSPSLQALITGLG